MRMWMLDPKILCHSHLAAEHDECHMIVGAMRKRKQLRGYVASNALELGSLFRRHEELVNEFFRRGWIHKSEMDEMEVLSLVSNYPEYIRIATVDRDRTEEYLRDKCRLCKERMDEQRRCRTSDQPFKSSISV